MHQAMLRALALRNDKLDEARDTDPSRILPEQLDAIRRQIALAFGLE